MNRMIRSARTSIVLALAALAALALVAAGNVAAGPGKAKGQAKGIKVSRGATTLTLDAGAVAKLTGAGAAWQVLKPAKDSSSTTEVDPSFPVTNGRLKITKTGDAVTAVTGKISHVGGLSLTEGASNITLRNLRIVLDAAPHLTALVSVNGSDAARGAVADLDVDLTKVSTATAGKKRWLMLEDVEVKLNQASADALNATFAPALPFAAGELVGTADVKTRIVGRKR